MKNKLWRVLPCLLAVLCLSLPTTAAASKRLPETVDLPDGFNPEGITAGPGATVYVGSINSGAVYRANVRTGQGQIVVPAAEGRTAIGLKWDRRTNLLYVAGGQTGKVFVYDALSGALAAELIATTNTTTFVNDAVITRSAVYFTDSYRAVIYRLPLDPGGQLPAAPTLTEIPLSGDFDFLEGEFNSNGIESTPDGQGLLIVSSVQGALYHVDPATGVAAAVDLNGATLTNGDGLLRFGRTLFVVQNFDNQILALRLSPDASSATVKRTLTNEHFDVPTTVARIGFSLYAVNARFATEVTPQTEYQVVRVPLASHHH